MTEEDVQKTNKSTPLPLKKLGILFLIQICDLLAGVGIFPYLSQLTVDLMGFDEKRDAKLVGYYSGFIGSSYYITQLFTAFVFNKILILISLLDLCGVIYQIYMVEDQFY